MEHRAEQKWRAEDLYDLPDDGRMYEVWRGRLMSEPSPGYGHGRIALRIGSALQAWARQHRCGEVVSNDSGFLLARDPDTVLGPDIAYVASERLRGLRDETRFFDGAPDLAVEVLSPGDRPGAVRKKLRQYLDAGTREMWVVDPQAREVQVWSPGESPIVLGKDDVLAAPGLMPGFSLLVAEIFETNVR